MKYKALMLDIDGTLVGYEENLLPSQKVVDAISRIKSNVVVCLVTGRSYHASKPVLESLSLENGYAIVNNGAYVLDLGSKDILYEQPIMPSDAEKIAKAFFDGKIIFYAKRGLYEPFYDRKPFEKGDGFEDISAFYVNALYPHDAIKKVFDALSDLSDLTLHKTRSRNLARFGCDITHAKATKAHGIEAVVKNSHLTRNDLVGCGDSYNDFPLLMACGFKVAMGNAIPELKEIADYVAPSVYDDGVADVIERFFTK